MSLPSSITDALTALGARIQELTGSAAPAVMLRPFADSGTMSISGNVPSVSLNMLADASDFIRVSGSYTVNETLQEAPNGTQVTRARVFSFDLMAAVGVDQRTCALPPIVPRQSVPNLGVSSLSGSVSHNMSSTSMGESPHSAVVVPVNAAVSISFNGSGGAVTGSPSAAPSYTMTGYNITKLTRYHYG